MKNPKNIIINFANLYEAMMKSSKGVRWKASVSAYYMNAFYRLHSLESSLNDGSYRISPYTIFTIYEPKKRTITSTKFKDRVFQRSLCDNYLYKEITKDFVEGNAANQKGKGTDYGRELVTRGLKNCYLKYGMDAYVLKGDIKDYFGSTPHSVAKAAVGKRVDDDWVREHVYKIIDSFDGDKGIGLGSQVSQLIQLAVLDDMDHLISEDPGVETYVRYSDDFVVMAKNKKTLLRILKTVRGHLSTLGLSLSDKKVQVFPIGQSFRFLGFQMRLADTGRVTWRILAKSVGTRKRKIRKQANLVKRGIMTIQQWEDSYAGWRAHAKKTDSRKSIHKMDRYFKRLKEEVLSNEISQKDIGGSEERGDDERH